MLVQLCRLIADFDRLLEESRHLSSDSDGYFEGANTCALNPNGFQINGGSCLSQFVQPRSHDWSINDREV